MRWLYLLPFLAALFGCSVGALDYRTMDFSKMVQATVEVEDRDGHGSGVLVSNDLVMTAAHVAFHSTNIMVKLSDGREVPGVVLKTWDSFDVALIKIPAQADGVIAKIACRSPKLGEAVFSLGYPLYTDMNLAYGHISSVNKMLIPGIDEVTGNLIPVDMNLAEGISGGPIFDSDGMLLGIATGFLVEPGRVHVPAGIGLITPASVFCPEVQKALDADHSS